MPEKIGKYHVVERIGSGGMGMIFKAHDPILDRLVAIKLISSEIEVTDELRVRFYREAQACAKLNHTNIVTVYDMGEDDGRLFIVMELLEGQELRRLIGQPTALTLEDKLSVMLQVCSGLHYAHQKGIVHRDMKPANVFVLRNGQVKILDFGIAQIASTQSGLTRTGLIMGTLRYIAPEQLSGRADHRSDMFSIGSVFYELLTARPPFAGEGPMQLLEQLRTHDPPPVTAIDASIPAGLAAIVQRAMRKNPAERFHDLEEMRGELEAVQGALTEQRRRVLDRIGRQRERIIQLQAALAERGEAFDQRDPLPAVVERSPLLTAQATERELAAIIAELEAQFDRVDGSRRARQRAEQAQEQMARARADAEKAQHPTEVIEQPTVVGGPVVPVPAAASSSDDRPARARVGALVRWRGGVARTVWGAATTVGVAAFLVTLVYFWRSQPPPSAPPDATRATGSFRPREPEVSSPPPSPSAPTDAVSRAAPPPIETKQPAARVRSGEQRSPDDHARVVPRQRLDAERAREDMLQARGTAEQAGAARYAPKLFATAQTQERDGQASFGRSEYEAAGRRFRDAQSDYQAATKAAERQRALALQEVQQARGEVAPARRAAEQAGVDRYATSNKMLASANSKERQGESALAEHDYAQAMTLFRGATADLEAAMQTAKAEANADAEMDKLRREVAARRDAAVKAEAPALAKTLFETATSREKEAERLAAARNLEAARQPFQEASSRYDEAARQASTLKEKRPEPPPPLPPGPSLGRFGPDASSAIQQVLNDLKRAYESKDLALVQRIRPGLRPEDLQSLRNTFDNASKYTLDLRVETIEVRGNDAQAQAFRQDVMVAKDGQIYRSEARVTVRFKRMQDRWTIDDIK